jgi:AcrR family transcriptional regulator
MSATVVNMTEPVKTRRRYDNSRREAQSRATRAQVVAAAGDLFLARGYPATTIEAVAAAADVPVASVYRLFGSKKAILKAVLQISFVGDDEPAGLHDRPEAQAAAAQSDPRALLAGYARVARSVLTRSGPLQQMLRVAAEADPDCAGLAGTFRQQRLAGQSLVARELAARGALAPGLTEEAALDTIYTLMSPEVHRLLTVERKLSTDQYEDWLSRALAATLLDGAAPPMQP